jgi:hypothetical protein
MTWLWYVGGVLIGLFGLFTLLVVWGLVRLRRGAQTALAEAGKVDMAEIESLARECVDVFQRELGVRLDLSDCEDAAAKLDAAFRDRHRLKTAFAREDFFWYFALPVGACLGELLRRHARHEWRKRPGTAPHMVAAVAGGESEAFPFEKAVKQAQGGEPGDLLAYVAAARALVARAGG